MIVVQHLFNYNFENIDDENETRQKSHFFPFRITVIVSENVETFVTQITANFRCFFFHPEAPIKIFTNWSIFYLVCMFNNLFCWYIVSSTSFNLHQIRDEKQKKNFTEKHDEPRVNLIKCLWACGCMIFTIICIYLKLITMQIKRFV